MVIQTEELVDGKQPTSVQVIRINGEEKSMDDLSEEERAMIENHSKHPQTKSMRTEEHHVEKVVEMKKDGNGEDGDVRIEVKVENGKEQVNVWLNGEQLSEDEAVAYAQEHDRLGGAHEEERDFVFVSEDEQVHKGKMIVKSEVRMENSGTPKKAVVVVKVVNSNKASGTSKIDGMAGGLRLFPNPASGEVKVQFDHEVNGLYEVNISTLDGKVLIAEEGQGKGAVTQRIDLSELAAGTYILTLSYSGGMNAQKLIVE